MLLLQLLLYIVNTNCTAVYYHFILMLRLLLYLIKTIIFLLCCGSSCTNHALDGIVV